MINMELYNAITEFADRFGSVKWNNDECVSAYKNLVDLCITAGKIPECNRKEPSTHGCLKAAISYEDNRQRFCEVTI